MEQHEKLIKDAHDHLTEASEQLKAALEQQVHVMLKHNDSQEVMVERTENLAIQARKEFRDLSLSSLSPLDNPERIKDMDAVTLRNQLREANALIKSGDKIIRDKNCDDFMKRIQQLEDENKKLIDQISYVGTKNYQRKLERTKEIAEARKLAEEYTDLRRKAEHNEEVSDRTKKMIAEIIERKEKEENK
jgi:hypothetical protein